MSNPNEHQDDDDQEGKPSRGAAYIKTLEAQIEASNAETLAAKRELLFIKAGVPTGTKMSEYFIKGYEGDLTVEAIRTAAIEATLIAETPPDPAITAEGEAQQRINAARTAGEQSAADTGIVAEIDAAKTPAELDAIMAKALAGQSV